MLLDIHIIKYSPEIYNDITYSQVWNHLEWSSENNKHTSRESVSWNKSGKPTKGEPVVNQPKQYQSITRLGVFCLSFIHGNRHWATAIGPWVLTSGDWSSDSQLPYTHTHSLWLFRSSDYTALDEGNMCPLFHAVRGAQNRHWLPEVPTSWRWYLQMS